MTQIETIFQQYLQHHDCTNLNEIKQEQSRIDAICSSGNSTLLIEFKRRYFNVSYSKYLSGALLEKDKFDSMLQLSTLLGNAKRIYMCEYDDSVLAWELDTSDIYYDWATMPCHINSKHGSELTDKLCTVLPYNKASIIISKHSWQSKTRQELINYLKRKNPDYEPN